MSYQVLVQLTLCKVMVRFTVHCVYAHFVAMYALRVVCAEILQQILQSGPTLHIARDSMGVGYL